MSNPNVGQFLYKQPGRPDLCMYVLPFPVTVQKDQFSCMVLNHGSCVLCLMDSQKTCWAEEKTFTEQQNTSKSISTKHTLIYLEHI